MPAAQGDGSARLPARVGRYRILRRLAKGGMAELFLARSEGEAGFAKVVVLKRIHWHLADDPDLVRLFVREAKLAASLDHPNIVQVHDFGRDEDDYFFTMEYVHGVTAAQLVVAAREAGGPVSLGPALAVALGVCTGLHYAHEAVGLDGDPLGLVHRDVAPNNILISYAGAVKVADFGIAKASGATSTNQDFVRGKAAYMSPEQCEGRPLDARSDVFAIGATVFELTTGRRLFGAKDHLSSMHRIVNGQVTRPSELVDGYPPALEAVVLRALSLRPEERFASADGMRSALKQVARECGVDTSMETLAGYVAETLGTRPHPCSEPRAAEDTAVDDLPETAVVPAPDEADTGRRRWPLLAAAIGGAAMAAAASVLLIGERPDPAQAPPVDAERAADPRAALESQRVEARQGAAARGPSGQAVGAAPTDAAAAATRDAGTPESSAARVEAPPTGQGETPAPPEPAGASETAPAPEVGSSGAASGRRKQRRRRRDRAAAPERPTEDRPPPSSEAAGAPGPVILGRDELPPSVRKKANRGS